MDINSLKKIHFVGVGGIGISATAKLMLSRGATVSGSDITDSDIVSDLRGLGATIYIGQKSEQVPSDADVVVYTDAAPDTNPERSRAKELGISQLSYFQFLGLLTKDYDTIGISGTHGKTTTTAMTGLVFEEAGRDPMVIVGSKVSSFKGNVRIGAGKEFIVEADEYRAHMLELAPRTILLTNIEADHLDYYRDLEHIIETFQAYVDRLPENGTLIVNDDDPVLATRLRYDTGTVIRYGLSSLGADISARDIVVDNGQTIFSVLRHGEVLGECRLQVPGMHNVSNALGVIALGLSRGIDFAVVVRALGAFSGTWRRFELLGMLPGSVPLISDYGHHPTEVLVTMQAARQRYPDKKIILAFQPHHTDRTQKLFAEFVTALASCPVQVLVISDIYEVPGREQGPKAVTSQDLVRELQRELTAKRGTTEVVYGKDLATTKSIIVEYASPGSVVVCMGAGTIDGAARELLS